MGNLGDEALREYFLRAFPGEEWHVVSARPSAGELPRLPLGFRSLLQPWWRTLAALRAADGVLFGGGTLFTDLESPFACVLWWWHSVVTRLFGKPLFLAFQGVGPFRTRVGEWCARWTLRHAVFVSVRDAASSSRVESWVLNTKIIQTSDPIIWLAAQEKVDVSSQNMLVIIPRHNSDAAFEGRAMDLFRSRAWSAVKILSLSPKQGGEQELCLRLRDRMGAETSVIPVRSLGVLLRELAGADLVLAQRYHGALAARALGKNLEVVPQGVGDKLSGLASTAVGDLLSRARAGEAALRETLQRLRG
ncbi:MAG: polysaccharide pyruvyl transferase family protein [Candidatus Peribacteraceae bacterium]|nr:polysaccharide pyruvyl transferase family protein [Candidatus Peribacteraceae bacterium]